MQLALLIQSIDHLETASVEAVGTIDDMFELKEGIDDMFELKEGLEENLLSPKLKEMIIRENEEVTDESNIIFPEIHLLIVDREVAFELNKNFRLHKEYHGVWELVKNPSLIQNYVS